MRGIETGIVWGVLGAVVLGLGLAVYRVEADPRAIVIRPDARAPWIAVDEPVTAAIRQWQEKVVAPVSFATTFEAGPGDAPVVLRFRSYGEATVRINDKEVFGGAESAAAAADWKRVVLRDVGHAVRPGKNQLGVEIRNARGPGLLSLSLEGRGVALKSGPDWLAARGGNVSRAATYADDTRPHVSGHRTESALSGWERERGTLAVLFFAGIAGFLFWRRFGSAQAGVDLARLAAFFVGVAWLLLFVFSFTALPLNVGFDAGSHLDYTRRLLTQDGLPAAGDGFATYHPPLFHALAGGAGKLSQALGLGPAIGLKAIPFLSGLALAALSGALARRIFPGRDGLFAASMLFAGLLPMNVLLAAYYGNEGLHAALAAAAVFVAVDVLVRTDRAIGRLALFSVLLGLALLTKFTAWIVAAVAGGALLGRLLARPGRAMALAALVLPAAAIAGWFYARNVALYGTPFAGNWALSGPGLAWWTQPGFHTPDYYLGFGKALSQPFLSGFESFLDALYSTTWGDGFLGGQGGPGARHQAWNYPLLAVVSPLALPATLLGMVGYARGLAMAVRHPEPGRRAALGLLAILSGITFFAIFWLTLELPFFGQAKAFYGLLLTPAIGLYLALGFEAADRLLAARGGALLRALLYGWAAAFLGAIFLAFLG